MLAAITVAPAPYLLITSLTPLNLINPQSGSDFSDPALNYRALWTGNFPASFVNSVPASTLSTALSLLIGVPSALEEAAWIDGCGVWGAFRRITSPLAAPGLAAIAVLCFVLPWNDFFFALILTRTNAQTAPVAIVNYIQYKGWEWGKIAAGGVLVMLPVVVFTLLVRTYLVRGLTAGGLKD